MKSIDKLSKRINELGLSTKECHIVLYYAPDTETEAIQKFKNDNETNETDIFIPIRVIENREQLNENR